MPNMNERKVILLANNSPILAPLALCHAMDAPVFKWIDFEFRPYAVSNGGEGGRGARHLGRQPAAQDILVDQVLSKRDMDSRYIAAVADPFRALLRKHAEGEEPCIIANVIQHQLYWLLSACKNRPNSEEEVAQVDRIFSQPTFMTGHSLLLAFLSQKCGVESKHLKDMIWPGTAGYEFNYYQTCVRQHPDNANPFAFITTDPRLENITTKDGPVKKVSGFRDSDLMRDTLMSAMFTSRTKYEINSSLLDEVKHALSKAIELIYDDPVAATTLLIARPSPRISLLGHEYSANRLLDTIKEFVALEAYSQTMKISAAQLKKGFNMRAHGAHEPKALAAIESLVHPSIYVEDPKPVNQHGVGAVASTAKPNRPASFDEHPLWSIFKGFVEGTLSLKKRRFISWTALLLFMVLASSAAWIMYRIFLLSDAAASGTLNEIFVSNRSHYGDFFKLGTELVSPVNQANILFLLAFSVGAVASFFVTFRSKGRRITSAYSFLAAVCAWVCLWTSVLYFLMSRIGWDGLFSAALIAAGNLANTLSMAYGWAVGIVDRGWPGIWERVVDMRNRWNIWWMKIDLRLPA